MKSFKQFREEEEKVKKKLKNKKSGNVEVMPRIPDSQKGMTTNATNEEVLNEKSVSKSQQRFFGMVRATQKGATKAPSPEVARVASSIKKSDAKDFAKTKHKGLPEKKVTKEETCGKGEYFCNDRKKCMPIPKGMKVRDDGFLTKESFESGVLKARRHHRVGKLMSFKDFMKIMGEILGEWEK
tara:strand:- start:706 stop:1254 length:549 start_codon:yes stop_codon:yes gene_type:complete